MAPAWIGKLRPILTVGGKRERVAVGQVGRRFPHVQLASDHVGNEAGAVFVEEVNLAFDCGAVPRNTVVGVGEKIGDGSLFQGAWEWDTERTKLLVCEMCDGGLVVERYKPARFRNRTHRVLEECVAVTVT